MVPNDSQGFSDINLVWAAEAAATYVHLLANCLISPKGKKILSAFKTSDVMFESGFYYAGRDQHAAESFLALWEM